ncbi:hypothetical protein B484DRAFT_482408 [Ochromonadaceae sp. CCMP2298]|nr:hypothetical protein B484DRAFT_482408 [Ochromonadaceae sp. CCMP2298]|eukprot:CAMPEP_0173217532 /NCGR_PEP_ID=MMETSP1142-20121109/545_1 /TAXON_ID=483371 /ORGANISM="non described non described, Strain CCMP2298" /LENGTH=310 /DNA_ID=CAMNT_0014145117 /DNA_START=315 /DNA_END=1247 /DNA_ORIENTATION=-
MLGVFVLLIALLFGLCKASPHATEGYNGRKPYNLVVVGVFKNESMILGEWIQHYVDEGVDHFYLVDHGSRDDYLSVLNRFPATLVTVVRDGSPHQPGLQDQLMSKYLTHLVSEEARWVLVVDIDEYMYAREGCIPDLLGEMPADVERLWAPWKVFGGGGHATQPESVVAGFMTRKEGMILSRDDKNLFGYGKHLARVVPSLQLRTHDTRSTSRHSGDSYLSDGSPIRDGVLLGNQTSVLLMPLQLNHYAYQSREYYAFKCIRGGGSSGHISRRYTMGWYDEKELESNSYQDTELAVRKKAGVQCRSALHK